MLGEIISIYQTPHGWLKIDLVIWSNGLVGLRIKKGKTICYVPSLINGDIIKLPRRFANRLSFLRNVFPEIVFD